MKLLKPSNDVSTLAPRPKHRKVKTGCRTCKKRHIKCDEHYPSCLRCLSTNRACEGYGIWGGGTKCPPTPLTTALAPPPPPPMSSPPSISTFPPRVCITPAQQVYLDWLIHGSPHHSPRIFRSPFWDPVILQLAQREPMVLRALLALAAAHRGFALGGGARGAGEVFLLREYGGAMSALRRHLGRSLGSKKEEQQGKEEEEGEEKTKLLLAVVMCSLFELMEYIRGEFESGGVHLNIGLNLIRKLRASATRAKHMETEHYIIFHFFDRLGDQTALFRSQAAGRAADASELRSVLAPSLRFRDVEEARYHLEDLVEIMAHLKEQAGGVSRSASAEEGGVVGREYAYLGTSFEAWRMAVDATVEDLGRDVMEEDRVTWGALRRRYDGIARGILA